MRINPSGVERVWGVPSSIYLSYRQLVSVTSGVESSPFNPIHYCIMSQPRTLTTTFWAGFKGCKLHRIISVKLWIQKYWFFTKLFHALLWGLEQGGELLLPCHPLIWITCQQTPWRVILKKLTKWDLSNLLKIVFREYL